MICVQVGNNIKINARSITWSVFSGLTLLYGRSKCAELCLSHSEFCAIVSKHCVEIHVLLANKYEFRLQRIIVRLQPGRVFFRAHAFRFGIRHLFNEGVPQCAGIIKRLGQFLDLCPECTQFPT